MSALITWYQGFLSNSVFILTCCYQPQCPHTECRSSKPTSPWMVQWRTCNYNASSSSSRSKETMEKNCVQWMQKYLFRYRTVFTDVFDKYAMSSTAPLSSTILKEFCKAKPYKWNISAGSCQKALLSIVDQKFGFSISKQYTIIVSEVQRKLLLLKKQEK